MELLVVIGVIALLIGITFAVGSAVVEGGKARLTQDTIRVLDEVVDAYEAQTNEPAPAYVNDPGATDERFPALYAVADAEAEGTLINSAGLLLSRIGLADGLADRLPANAIQDRPAASGGPLASVLVPTPVDAWGRSIRFVHPAWDGAYTRSGSRDEVYASFSDSPPRGGDEDDSVRRRLHDGFAELTRTTSGGSPSAEDATDLGRCADTRGYFYSAGADGQAGVPAGGDGGARTEEQFRQANVYAERVPEDGAD